MHISVYIIIDSAFIDVSYTIQTIYFIYLVVEHFSIRGYKLLKKALPQNNIQPKLGVA